MSHSPSPAAGAAAEAGAKNPDDRQQLRQREEEVFVDAAEELPPPPPPAREGEEAAAKDEPATLMGKLQLNEEKEEEGDYYYDEDQEPELDADHDEYDEAHNPVGLGAGGLISPALATGGGGHHHAHHDEDPALANTLSAVCDVCELAECACDKVAARRGVFFEGTPAETKRGGKPHGTTKAKAIEPTSWRPANKSDYRSHHRPPHRDPRHASVASRDADFVGDVPHGEHGTRSGKMEEEEEESSSSAPVKPPPVSAIDAEVQPPVVPMPGKKGRPSHVGGDRIPALEVAHDPFERAGAPSSAAGAGGRGHVAGHKHRGQRHQDFTTLG